ncbi:MAG: VWA domain-containing protein, partial [Pseudomonadota bacterium]
MRRHFLCKFVTCVSLSLGSTAWGDENVMVVFDGSNSMWGQIEGVAKIEIARDAMGSLLGEWVDGRQVGLMAYGHRRRGDCGDIEVLVEPGEASRQSILDRINGVTPTGKTPLTDAVEQAANALSYTDQPATVVLISDGLESCERDPCALAQALEQSGVGFTAHVVGFGLGSDEDASSLSCIAENTGGQYITATNATELGAAFSAVSTAVAEAAPDPAPEPEPEPEPEAPQVAVDAPDTAVAGSNVDVTWTPTVAEADYINIVPAGTDDNVFGIYARIGTSTEVTLMAPGDAGFYEVRYLHNATKEVLGQDTLEVAEASVELTAPDSAETGARVGVSWTPTINEADYIAIVPAGSDAGTFGNYQRIGGNSEINLTAQADPGLYEVRYILNVDKSTVATRQIEITSPQVTLQTPDSTLTGADFEVSWSASVSNQDYINIVPMGAAEGEFGNYIVVRDVNRGTLKAPAETGMYEVRYVLREGARTVARETIEVAAPEISIAGPERVSTGEKFTVTWTGAVHPQDYAAIVPAGSDEGVYGNYVVVRDDTSGTLTAQADPGLYELRYILREGAKTMATAMIEVTEPEVTLNAPEMILAGSKFEVSWTGAVSDQDYIGIVPMGSDEGEYGNYIVVRDDTSGDVQAPSAPGLYEV